MSVVRLLISGLLVASGLVLAAFTLHGAFDGGQVQASGGPALKPWSTNTLPGSVGGKASPPQTGSQPDAKPSAAASDAKAAKKKKRAEKGPSEQAQKSKQPPQQAALQWPWSSWFGN
jgi:hypothetical protein